MEPEILRCYDNYIELRLDVDSVSTIFTDWGKGRIKETRCSPDAFFQMAIQLAYYRVITFIL